MEAQSYWLLFLKTGRPEAYLLYRHAQRTSEEALPA